MFPISRASANATTLTKVQVHNANIRGLEHATAEEPHNPMVRVCATMPIMWDCIANSLVMERVIVWALHNPMDRVIVTAVIITEPNANIRGMEHATNMVLQMPMEIARVSNTVEPIHPI